MKSSKRNDMKKSNLKSPKNEPNTLKKECGKNIDDNMNLSPLQYPLTDYRDYGITGVIPNNEDEFNDGIIEGI